ncbi:MAG: DUF2203 domain-containing protein [Candidatus Dormibacterales bacterium]
MEQRTYTLAEANRVLPEVKGLAERIVEMVAALPELQEQARARDYERRREAARGSQTTEEEYQEAAGAVRGAELELARALAELESLGVRLKDPGAGLMDFLSYRDGELVELCWRLGEAEVGHWHRIGEGFPGRKPV